MVASVERDAANLRWEMQHNNVWSKSLLLHDFYGQRSMASVMQVLQILESRKL